MSEEREPTYISLNAPNIVTISLAGALGFGVLWLATYAWRRVSGNG